MSAIGNLVKGPARDALDKAQKAAPAAIDKTITEAGVAITGSTVKATALFADLYAKATTAIAAWIPNLKPWLLNQLAKAVTAGKAYVGKL